MLRGSAAIDIMNWAPPALELLFLLSWIDDVHHSVPERSLAGLGLGVTEHSK